jgi:hypothetical protein
MDFHGGKVMSNSSYSISLNAVDGHFFAADLLLSVLISFIAFGLLPFCAMGSEARLGVRLAKGVGGCCGTFPWPVCFC